MGTSAQEDEENAQSVSGLSVGSGDGGAKELGGGKPGTGRSEKSATRVSKRSEGVGTLRVER